MVWGAWAIYVLTPLYNHLVLDDSSNLDPKVERQHLNSKMFLLPLYAYVLAMAATHVWCLMLFSGNYDGLPGFQVKPDSAYQYFVFCVVLSFFGSLSSLAGHELVHHKQWYNKAIGNFAYTQFFYSHFWDEHTRGHHKNIATPLDPVCHDTGVDCYSAMVKAVIGTHVTTWQREQERLSDIKNPALKLVKNRMVHYFALHCSMLAAIYHFFGTGGLKFQAAYTFTGLFWAEMVNYLEHYGLQRRKDSNGIYESIGCMHSWNSLSSPVAFRIQRHSDHHAHVFRPY